MKTDDSKDRMALLEVQKVQEVKQEIQQMVARLPMVVSNAEESLAAKTAIIAIRKESKLRKGWFQEHILSHSKKAYDEAKAAYDAQKLVLADLLKPMNDWEYSTDRNIRTFEEAERRRQEAERRREAEKYQKRLDAAEAKGKDPVSVKPAKLVVAKPKSVRTSAGVYTVKTIYVVEIVNEELIPARFWLKTLNRGLIESELRQGQDVPGAILRDTVGSAIRG